MRKTTVFSRAYPALVLSVAAGLLACTAHPGQPARTQAANAGQTTPLAPVASRHSRSPRMSNASSTALEYLGAPLPADLRVS